LSALTRGFLHKQALLLPACFLLEDTTTTENGPILPSLSRHESRPYLSVEPNSLAEP